MGKKKAVEDWPRTRKSPLCCIINPITVCVACDAKVCYDCNTKDWDGAAEHDERAADWGHQDVACIGQRDVRLWVDPI